jgi:hypothetical protein
MGCRIVAGLPSTRVIYVGFEGGGFAAEWL